MIKDSRDRKEVEMCACRGTQGGGKGRCDILPLTMVGDIFANLTT